LPLQNAAKFLLGYLLTSYQNRQECLFYRWVGQTFLSDHKVLGQLINPHSLVIR